MKRPACTRILAFDAAHRVTRHGGKCKNFHGHRYTVEVTCSASELTEEGFVIDFSKVKALVGGWIDEHWDHGSILYGDNDADMIRFLRESESKVYVLNTEPTAENMAAYLLRIANGLLAGAGIQVTKVRVYETPNCYADAEV